MMASVPVRLWDVGTRRQLGDALAGHTGSVLGVAFSPDGELLASAGADLSVRLWQVSTRSGSVISLSGP